MFRFVPPAGTPIKAGQVLAAFRDVMSSNGHEKQSLAPLASYLGVRYAFGASSGRAALCTILRGLRRIRPQADVVALPAYTCFSVAAAVVRAGLKIHLLDVNPETLDFDVSGANGLPAESLLCIVTANLFGYVNDVRSLRDLARARSAFLVDDAAQALGAVRDGQPAGARGDVGLFSLGRGKALSAMEGGLIVTSSEDIAHAVEQELAHFPPPSSLHGAWLAVQLLAYSALLRPGLYRIPRSMPFLKLGVTEFDPGFAVAGLHPLSRSLFLSLLNQLQSMNEVRRENAEWIISALQGHLKLSVPRLGADTQPTMVRLPVIASDEDTRALVLKRLRQAGIDASAFYPSSICDIDGIGAHMAVPRFHRTKAEHLSRTLFTLPVHPLVERQDLERTVDVLYSQ